ncbi:hypothetical protein BD626DRAFT_410417 [Schizophyllum amplum]|uniref:Pyridoxamine 5'-phosphate oxidase N-terminal domain-containing protein n=1 Tax=Schizophyllum amplum TaxID=97359 RepID=A0A550C1B6_9AGAR|nr:hypothetical protein BD626DRAFT_410417 [Auriculariopsis ampla]
MVQFYDEMPDWLMPWIVQQHLFFVATCANEGHVNVSPKCADETFHVVDSRKVWYEDLSGSGIETISHIQENGRITVMFTAFDKPPRIARLWGTGTFHEFGTPEYNRYIPSGTRRPGSRAVIEISIHRVGTSCGYAVPFYEYTGPRTLLDRCAARFESQTTPDRQNVLRAYWRDHNLKSLDGLPGLQVAHETTGNLVNAGVLQEIQNPMKNGKSDLRGGYGFDMLRLLVGTSAGVLVTLLFLRFVWTDETQMGSFYDEMPDWLMAWLVKQHMFFVATAARDGHVNVSPKGLQDTFHVVDSKTVWYEDLSGSGVETISHLRENGRITIMLTAFDKPPRIARLFGTGTVYEYGTPEYEKYIPAEKRKPGSRSVILVDIHKVGSSCGYSVPFYEFQSHRNVLEDWAARKEQIENDGSGKGVRGYWREWNAKSIDGLPGLQVAHETTGKLVSIGAPVGLRKGGIGESLSGEGHVAQKAKQGLASLCQYVDLQLALGVLTGVLATLAYARIGELRSV